LHDLLDDLIVHAPEEIAVSEPPHTLVGAIKASFAKGFAGNLSAVSSSRFW
jgi:hypothetical protein